MNSRWRINLCELCVREKKTMQLSCYTYVHMPAICDSEITSSAPLQLRISCPSHPPAPHCALPIPTVPNLDHAISACCSHVPPALARIEANADHRTKVSKQLDGRVREVGRPEGH